MPAATSSVKPARWNVSPGMVAPEWRWAWRDLVVAWPIWEGRGPTLRDVADQPYDATLESAGQRRIDTVGPVIDLSSNTVTVDEDQRLLDLPLTYDWTAVIFHHPHEAAVNTPILTWGGGDRIGIQPNSTDTGSGGAKLYWQDIGGTIISEDGPDYTGEWKSVAVGSWASDDHRWYRDGVLVGSSSASGVSGGFTNVQIGNLSGTSAHYNGLLASILIFGRALSEGEIHRLSLDPFAPFRPAL